MYFTFKFGRNVYIVKLAEFPSRLILVFCAPAVLAAGLVQLNYELLSDIQGTWSRN